MRQRILHEIGQHLRQQLPVPADGDAGLDAKVEPVLQILGRRLVGLADLAGDLRKIDQGEAALLRARLDLGNAQQGREGLEQQVGLGDRGVGGGRVLGGRCRMLARIFQTLAQSAERRAQIVGDVVGNLAQPLHEMLDAVEHGVEAGHELVDFVVGAAHGNARGEVACHDGATGAADRVDAAQEAAAQQHATRDGEEERDRRGDRERTLDRVLHVDQPARILCHEDERAVGEGQAEAGELAARVRGLATLGVAHEVDHAIDRRHAGQVADHDLLGRRLEQVVDRPARAEVHAPRDLFGRSQQAAMGVDLGQLVRLGTQHRLHVALHRASRRDVNRRKQHQRRDDEQRGIDQRQPEAG